ncbi:cytochrome P450 [Aspergillus multicolor]|uniref:cytochrome P450 n=1 Tax=Aspergillus multicolor TaxID=41759 RepID=UPI003CCD7609
MVIPLLPCTFLVVLVFLIIHRKYKHKAHLPVPPGPISLPLFGNVLDLPPSGVPEYQHWLKHKDIYGLISSIKVLGLTLTIIHDKDDAQFILGKKAHKTSERSQLNFATLCGFENFLITHQFNDVYKRHRRMVHGEMGTRALSERFSPVQEEEVLFFQIGHGHLLTWCSLAAAIILKITYGYSVDRENPDPLVDLIEHAMDHLSLAFVPCSWLINVILAIDRLPLPKWFPGMSYKRTAKEWKAVNEASGLGPRSSSVPSLPKANSWYGEDVECAPLCWGAHQAVGGELQMKGKAVMTV